MSVQEEAQLMERMEGSGAAPPDSAPEVAVSKPARQGGPQANGVAAKKASGHAAGQAPPRDTGQGEDPVQRLTQVTFRWSTPIILTCEVLAQPQHLPRTACESGVSKPGAEEPNRDIRMPGDALHARSP